VTERLAVDKPPERKRQNAAERTTSRGIESLIPDP
jgi:hypothetical protein